MIITTIINNELNLSKIKSYVNVNLISMHIKKFVILLNFRLLYANLIIEIFEIEFLIYLHFEKVNLEEISRVENYILFSKT